jgi:hypothetical protein
MRFGMTGAIMFLAVATLAASIPPAFAQNCQQLWVERNSYYKAHGYCFKTARAIAYFGNGGCYIRNESRIPLSPRERARIAEINRLERSLGC